MSIDNAALNTEQTELLTQLAQSRASVLALAKVGQLDQAKLWQLANKEANLSLLLYPMPLDPGQHVLAAHAFVHPYLERLSQHDPAHAVIADETHRYTPRKILRRVLDHALDHLNQIEQWLAWQQQGTVPTPTDGWATSDETLAEDVSPLSSVELQAWLWRIDLTVEMVANRAKSLRPEQLDWVPPDGGWTLRQMLRHLARAEVFYAAWLDEALPDEPVARYSEANSRFEQRLRQVLFHPVEEQLALFNPEEGYTMTTAEQVTQNVLAEERTLMYQYTSL